MNTKKKSPATPIGGSDTNRGSEDSTPSKVSEKTVPAGLPHDDPVSSLAQRSIACDPARAHGHLEVCEPWSLNPADLCEPCCAGCGNDDMRASVAFFESYPELRGPESANFDLCARCAAVLWDESAEGRLLRVMLEINGFCSTLQKRIDREGVPPSGGAT
jgi:hypothetical protein